MHKFINEQLGCMMRKRWSGIWLCILYDRSLRACFQRVVSPILHPVQHRCLLYHHTDENISVFMQMCRIAQRLTLRRVKLLQIYKIAIECIIQAQKEPCRLARLMDVLDRCRIVVKQRSKSGAPERARTSHLTFRKRLLYPDELRTRSNTNYSMCAFK